MKLSYTLMILTCAAILPACAEGADQPTLNAATDSVSAEAPKVTATLIDRDGKEVGIVTATETNGMLAVSGAAMGLPMGEHGAHIHTTGDCSAADFTSAGGHWNPAGANHGSESEPPHPHAGDLPNLLVADDGTGTIEATSTGTFAQLMDEDGSAFVIHADPDDYKSQPTGNAGARIVCGVFTAG